MYHVLYNSDKEVILMKSIVSMKWLLARLYENDQVIVDCRFVLGNSNAGKEAYIQGHIPGAVYMDLEQQMSASIQQHGGRHPLPDMESFAQTLGQLGIDHNVRVVAYDNQGGAMASRLWWLLKYMGHEQVYVLDGGFSRWNAEQFPVTSAPPTVAIPKRFTPNIQHDMLVSMADVKQRLGTEATVLVDSREERRYLGIEEPIDRVAGHIPGAVNHFWKHVLNESGGWKSAEEMRESFRDLDPTQEVIVYCGSGVTACPNVLALQEAGCENVKLYAGSWSDWISYEDNPIAVGEEVKV